MRVLRLLLVFGLVGLVGMLLVACDDGSGLDNPPSFGTANLSAFNSSNITPRATTLPRFTATPTLKVTAAPSPAVSNKKWVNVSPPDVSTDAKSPPSNFGFQAIAVDPQNGAVYVGTCNQGLWKSTDRGNSWFKVNTGKDGSNLDTGRLWSIAIDPVNPQILYTTAGYGYGGVLKSTNGGKDWTNMLTTDSTVMKTVNSGDINAITLDPQNHEHILAVFHSVQAAGQYYFEAPVIESLDGGNSWTVHPLPKLGQGHFISFMENSATWLLGTVGKGFWRTTDSGQTWAKVSNYNTIDGGASLYRAKTGIWYLGGESGVLRSIDGISWKLVATQNPVYSVLGDGNYIYFQPALPGLNPGGTSYYYISAEADGVKWVVMNSQTFTDGPLGMTYDPVNHILYSSNWRNGVWKLELDQKP